MINRARASHASEQRMLTRERIRPWLSRSRGGNRTDSAGARRSGAGASASGTRRAPRSCS